MRFSSLLIIVVCMTQTYLWAQGEERETASRIIALEKAWNQAYKLGDRKALNELFDDQLLIVNDDGSVQNKSQFLATIKPANPQEQQVLPDKIEVYLHGDSATTTGIFRQTEMRAGRPYIKRERFLDTWVYRGERWRCVSAAAITIVH
jgi:hypothetical protein